ncbi:MAG: hypothetical protein LBI18_15130 [Planctomycetaceae bacterium]|jgi:hypothetical protein|nr:hypothetical protein [Planctomycetaceae bacterium]
MRKRLFVSAWSLMVLLTVYVTTVVGVVGVGAEPTIITYQSNVKALTSSDFVKRLTALPEWEPFFDLFTQTCDKRIDKELSRENLQRKLPEPIVNDLRFFLESGISTKNGIETVFQHLEAVIGELQADFDHEEIDENLQDITDLLQGRKKDLDLEFDGLLAFIVDVNPRSFLTFLKYFRERTDYRFLRNEPNGDFVLKFDFEYRDRDIEFCCAGVKLANGRYVFLFSDDDSIEQYCRAFRTGRYAQLDTAEPKKEIVLEETCFRFLDRQLKKLKRDFNGEVVIENFIDRQQEPVKLNSNGLEFFGKIKKATMTLHEVNGVSQLHVKAIMRTAEDARFVRDLLMGLLAFAQLNVANNAPERGLLQAVQIDASGADVLVTVKLDNPELWKLIAKGLQQATEKLKNRQ